MTHVLTDETADAVKKWTRCGTCESWVAEDESMEGCEGPTPDVEDVRRVLLDFAKCGSISDVPTLIKVAQAYLRMRESEGKPAALGCVFCNARTNSMAALCEHCRSRTITSRAANAATSPTIEMVINACAAADRRAVGDAPLMIFLEPDGDRKCPKVAYYDRSEHEGTIAASLRKMFNDAVAKIRDRHATDVAHLERLGVAP